MINQRQLACHECDLMVNIPQLENGQIATCPRCGFVFTRFFKNAPSRLLAFSTTALIFLALSFVFPFMILTVQGNEKSVSFIQTLQSMGNEDYLVVVVFMLITTITIPLIFLLGTIYVLLSAKLDSGLPFTRRILRFIISIQVWNMAEIFLLGLLVSMIKIASLAQVKFGWSFVAFVLYIVSMATTQLYLDRYQVWQWLRHHQSGENPQRQKPIESYCLDDANE